MTSKTCPTCRTNANLMAAMKDEQNRVSDKLTNYVEMWKHADKSLTTFRQLLRRQYYFNEVLREKYGDDAIDSAMSEAASREKNLQVAIPKEELT